MKCFAATLLISLGWLLGGAAVVSAAELPGPAVPDGLGVNIHFTDPRPGEMEMLVSAGFRWVRMDMHWSATERKKGEYDFSAYDRLLAALDKRHVRALLILCYGNPLYDNGASPVSEETQAAFVRWAVAGVKHFRGRGVLWEMYNEPNISTFWKPQPSAEAYSSLAIKVGKALHEAAPDELYVGPATSRVDFAFLEDCFKRGVLEYWDAVTIHPYRPINPETVAPDYQRVRKLIEQYGPAGKKIPILAAEWGYSSVWRSFDDVRQGKMLAREFLINLSNDIPLTIWYDWHDDGEDPKEPEHHFGIVQYPYNAKAKPVYEPKPAYLAAKTLMHTLRGFKFKERLPVGSDDDYVLVFAKGTDVRIAAWTTAAEARERVIPVAAGVYSVRSFTGKNALALTAAAKGVTVALTDAPVYLIPRKAAH